MNTYYVYILASGKNATLYIGVTNNLIKRVWEHREKVIPGFTRDYSIGRLVYFETTASIEGALRREKRLKKWDRAWKINLIEKENPGWKDLYETLI